MMDIDLELGGNSTNPRVESEPVFDDNSSESRLDSASVHLIAGPSDSSTVVHDVERVGVSVAEGSIDSVSVQGNVSDVNNTRAEDSNKSGVSESHEKEVVSDRKRGSLKHVKSQQKKGQRRTENLKSKETSSPVYDSMISMFDEFAANGSVASEDSHRSSMEVVAPGHGFEVGDMVWGKVKSHPWWPGHIFSEEFATPSVRRSKREGLMLVAFFGDSSYGWFDPSEVIPFDSNFAEKSRQTNSKTFVKAVEEAIDEVSRRSALGLSCMCRSKQNFRPTDVEGYFAVDVTDYEPGAVYSIGAIEKARDGFKPSLALDFIRQLALEPMASSGHVGIDFIKNKANVISYRRAVYEEFDETYSQAFGYATGSPSPGSVQEPASRKPPKAPLSGRQVFADTSGKGGKGSAKSNKPPKDHAKKDKYLFKRRDEPKEAVKVQKKQKAKVKSSPQHVEDSITIAPSDDFVLQKRVSTAYEPAIADNDLPSIDSTERGVETMEEDKPIVLKSEDPKVDGDDDKRVVENRNITSDLVDEKSNSDKKVIASQRVEKKVKVSKRPAAELGSGKSVLPEKKKMKKKKHAISDNDDATRAVHLKKPIEDPQETTGLASHETELPRVLGDLFSLARDPLQAIKRGKVAKTRQVFLKFRSLVFQKSLNLSTSAAEDDSSKSLENGEGVSPVKPQASSSGRPDDPTKGGRKRGPSDRQEEMAAKKKKKVGDIRNLTQEKKVVKKIDESPTRDVMKKSRPEFVKKTEQRAPPEPTILMMKFPTGGSLPSINELKARFARYGPMDHSATRIFWNTSTCRVVYKYKADAQSACRFVVGSGSLFGNTGVKCSLKEVSEPEPPGKVDHQPPLMENRPPPQATTPGVQLKSILKKSGGEEAAGNGGRGRVKFLLGGEESQIKSNMNMENKNGASSFSSSSTSHTTMDFNSKNFQKAVNQSSSSSNPLPLLPLPKSTSVSTSSTVQFTKQQLPPPPPPPPPNSMHYATPLAPPLPPPPTLTRSLNYGSEMTKPTPKPPLLPPPPGVFVHNLQRPNIGLPTTPKVDISQQMLSLLTKCNEVVTNVTNVLGYVPYHPL